MKKERYFRHELERMFIAYAIDNRDYMLIQGAVLVIALAFVLVNLAVDIVYMLINPRVSYEGGS